MVRRWSVCLWPTVLAAISDSTRSGGPSRASSSAAGASSAMKSIWKMVTPSIGSVGRQHVDADNPGARGPFAHHLAPTAGSDAEVDHPLRALQQAEPLIQFG